MADELTLLDGQRVRLRDWLPVDVAALPGLLDPSRSWHETNGPYFGGMSTAAVQAEVARTAETAAADPRTLPTPRASLAVVTSATGRLGFTEEGWFRQARRWSGGVHDSVVLGILRQEWQHSLPT